MSAILAVIGSKLGIFGGGLLAGVGVTAAIALGKKFLPKYFGDMVSKALGAGFSGIDKITDPVEHQLVENIAIDVVKWVEYKIPDSGQGRARFELAAQKLCSLLPFLKGRDKDLADLIEKAVAAMDAELKKESQPK